MSDEKPVALPTFSGEKNRTEARQMSAAIGDVTGYRTRIQTNGDGSTTTLRTKGGMPRLVTTRSSEDVDEVSEKIVTVRPLSDYYPLGFEFDSESQALVSANYTWPRKTWPFYSSLLVPNEGGGAVKVKKLAARKLHPGSTTWEDTRPNREHKSVLSWEAPFGGRNVANGKNYGRDSVGFYQAKHPGWDIYNVPLALDPEPPDNYEVYVDWPSPGQPLVNNETSCYAIVSGGVRGYVDDGYGPFGAQSGSGLPIAGSMLPLLGYDAPTTSATWLYEDGKRLFKVEGLLTAAKLGAHYRCITATLSTKRFADAPVTNVRVVDYDANGTVVREVPVNFPRSIYWVWQVPFINSSGTKAAGIFTCDSNNGNVHPTSCYEIDLITGQVTEPLETTAASTYSNPSNTTNYASSYSGVVACDYRGDILVEMRMSGSTSHNTTTSGDVNGDNYSTTTTRTISISLVAPGLQLSGTFSNASTHSVETSYRTPSAIHWIRYYHDQGMLPDGQPEIPAHYEEGDYPPDPSSKYVSSYLSENTQAQSADTAEPVYVDLRYGAYAFVKLSSSGSSSVGTLRQYSERLAWPASSQIAFEYGLSEDNWVIDETVSSPHGGAINQSCALDVYIGGSLKKSHDLRTNVSADGAGGIMANELADLNVGHFTAFSRKNEILYSFVGKGSHYTDWSNLVSGAPTFTGVKFGSFLTTNKRTVEVKLDNKFNYPGELKWFSEPYMGPYVRNDPKKDEE